MESVEARAADMLRSLRGSDDGPDTEWVGSVGSTYTGRGCPNGTVELGTRSLSQTRGNARRTAVLPVGSIPAGPLSLLRTPVVHERELAGFKSRDVHGTVGGRLAPNADLVLRLGPKVTQARKVRTRGGDRLPAERPRRARTGQGAGDAAAE